MSGNPEFLTLIDDLGLEYLAFNMSTIKKAGSRPKNATGSDICTFLSETLPVSRRATGPFSTDLTTRDDLILAILSLLLLLIIEGTLTTILLRSRRGRVSTFAFSIKQFVELAREFKFRYLVFGRRRPEEAPAHRRSSVGATSGRRRINVKLLVMAASILTITFGLEAVILYLTSPELTDVTNDVTSFQLANSNPEWNEIRKNQRAATIRPCTAVTFLGVEQENNQISACLTAQGIPDSVEEFASVAGDILVNITTTAHEYGEEHNVQMGDDSANYSARAYFYLGDGKPRMMRRRVKFFNKEASFGATHKQLIAYLFTAYARQMNDTKPDIETLQNLKFNFTSDYGPVMSIIHINGEDRYRQVTSVVHTTIVKGPIPGGVPALQFAQAVFKGSIAMALGGPDRYDLRMGSGNTFGQETLMWRETSRSLNWLTLSIILACAIVVFALLRCIFRPISTAEIAGAYVIGAVGAEKERPPAWLAEDEKSNFSLSVMSSDAIRRFDMTPSGLTPSLEQPDDTAGVPPEYMQYGPTQEYKR